MENAHGKIEKNYLKEFTIITERRAVEVELWDDYLIAASVFGIADTVFKEFKELVTEYIFARDIYGDAPYSDSPMNYILLANSFSNSLDSGFSRAESARRSSGRGGSSSSGGGSSGYSGGGSAGGSR